MTTMKSYLSSEFRIERDDTRCIRCQVCVRQCSYGTHEYDPEDEDHDHRGDRRQPQRGLTDTLNGRIGNLTKTGDQNRNRGNDEEQIQADDAIDEHAGQGFRMAAVLVPAQHHGLQQVTADDAHRGQVEQVAEESEP